ncbi:hypothetical protein DAI22_06g069950 [Oryza sativa Japonica Group]|nr:hypothetical protein DAI22_06g069950 [Oryza sativa Japonica Group]
MPPPSALPLPDADQANLRSAAANRRRPLCPRRRRDTTTPTAAAIPLQKASGKAASPAFRRDSRRGRPRHVSRRPRPCAPTARQPRAPASRSSLAYKSRPRAG